MLLETAANANKGKCILLSSFNTKGHCSSANTVMVQEEDTDSSATDTRPTNCRSATYFCGYCATSTKCDTFFYAAAVTTGTAAVANGHVFATLTAAELSCLTCAASHFVEVAIATNVAGSCTAAVDVPCSTANKALIKISDATTTGTIQAAFHFC